VTLDTIGLLPTPEELAAFAADQSPDKRAKAIDRLLADSRWADQWMPVLAGCARGKSRDPQGDSE
jgi:hypothetical protein